VHPQNDNKGYMAKKKKIKKSLGRRIGEWAVVNRRLTAAERIGNRLGYMGSAFIMMSPYLLPYDNLGAYTYLIGAILSIPQVFLAKQWNLVVINLNLLIGYGLYLYR
jgi:hypothetical protein